MAQEPKDRRRRPSAQMVKAERYFFSNWPLQLLPSRRWRASVNKSGSHTRHVYAAADPHATRVRPAPPDGRQPVPYGQLCAWLFANKNSLPPSDFCGQQMVKRAETVHSTSASGVQSCAQVNIDWRRALSSVLRTGCVCGRPINAIVTPETCAAPWSLPARRRSAPAP